MCCTVKSERKSEIKIGIKYLKMMYLIVAFSAEVRQVTQQEKGKTVLKLLSLLSLPVIDPRAKVRHKMCARS